MHYFSNKFSKIAKRWGLTVLQRLAILRVVCQTLGAFAPLNLQYWWPEVPWFGQIVDFKADYDEIEIQNIVMTSFQW